MSDIDIKAELKALAPQFLVVVVFGLLLGSAIATTQSYKDLCIIHCNMTCGEHCEVQVGFACSSCTCKAMSGDLNWAKENVGNFENLSISLNISGD